MTEHAQAVGAAMLMIAASLEWPQMLTTMVAFHRRRKKGHVRTSVAPAELLVGGVKIACYAVGNAMLIDVIGLMPVIVSVAWLVFTSYKVFAYVKEKE